MRDYWRDRCLDGCYGNRRHSEALCIVTLAGASREGKRVKQGDEGLGNEKGGWERLNKQLARSRSKLQTVRVSMTAAREGSSARASEATSS